MANNLFISYDLSDPDKNFDAVAETIQKLGDWGQINPTLWYVRSQHSSEQAAQMVWAAMNASADSLTVIDASNNTANWQNIDPEMAQFFESRWNEG
jgi:hypothetical protein